MARYFNNNPVGSNYLTVDDESINNLSEFSISFWANVHTLSPPAPQVFFEKLDQTGFTWNVSIKLSRTAFSFSVKRSMTNCFVEYGVGHFNLSIDTWNNLVFIFNLGYNPRVYLNGEECVYNTATLTAGIGSLPGDDGNTRIGQGLWSGISRIRMRISEFGYWNRELTDEEIVLLSTFESGISPQSPIMISDGLLGCWRLYGNSGSVFEPNYIANERALITGSLSSYYNPSNLITRDETEDSLKILGPSETSFERGKIIAQEIDFDGSKDISKVSLYLKNSNSNSLDYILEEDGIASWSALNFQEISNQKSWTIYNTVSDYIGNDDISVDQGFLTNADLVNYSLADEVYLSSPKISYQLYLGAGTYKLWARVVGTGSFWYSWDSDSSPYQFTLSSTVSSSLLWCEMTSFSIPTSGLHTLNIYAGSAASQGVRIDQFRMIDQENVEGNTDIENQQITYPLSKSPYNTFLRIRPKNRSLTLSDISWSWKSSKQIKRDGWHNYDMTNPNFSEGVFMEYIVISGSNDNNASWSYSVDDNSFTSYVSTNYGSTFSQD